MTTEYSYGKLDLADAHKIAGGTNALLIALQEHAEAHAGPDPREASLVSKGVDMGDALLDMSRLLVAPGVFSRERHLSEILIYSAAVADRCEVCALTHFDGAIRAKAPEAVVDTVQAIALYIRAQADDDTHLLFDAYTRHWQRFSEWPHLSGSRLSNLKFYNLVALLMSLVVRKQRLVRLHTRDLLTKSDVTPAEILEIIGIAQIMGGFPARWEAVHIRNVAFELRDAGQLPAAFMDVLDLIPSAPSKP